jgi:hypothetical protein
MKRLAALLCLAGLVASLGFATLYACRAVQDAIHEDLAPETKLTTLMSWGLLAALLSCLSLIALVLTIELARR